MPSSGMLRHMALVGIHIFIRNMLRMIVITKVALSSAILVTLMMEAIRSSETLVLTKDMQHNIPEDGILHFN
jgi:hypothetical protein